MADRNFKLHSGKSGSAITVRVSPRSSKNEITDILDDGTVKVRLTAPPVDGKANQALIEYMAKVLDVKPGSIEIVAGLTSKDKLLTIIGLKPEEVQQKLVKLIS
jgi:uncharacterized protein